jgi:hypothetical protein
MCENAINTALRRMGFDAETRLGIRDFGQNSGILGLGFGVFGADDHDVLGRVFARYEF